MRLYATLLNPCSRSANAGKLMMMSKLSSASSSAATTTGVAITTHTSSANLFFNNTSSRHFSLCSFQCAGADENQSSSSTPSSSDRKPQGERKPFVRNYDRQKQQQQQTGERRFSNQQQGERRQFNNQQQGARQRTQPSTQNTQYVKKPYKPRTATEGEQTNTQQEPTTTGTMPTTSGTSTKAKRTISKEEAENLLKEAQKLKELQRKLNKNTEESTGGTPVPIDDVMMMEEDLLEPTKFVDKSALSEEIEKKKYLMRLEGKKKQNTGEKASSTKKKGTKKRERKRSNESEESEEATEESKSLQIRKKTGEEEEDVFKVDIEMNPKYAEYIDRMYTGTTPQLLAEQNALLPTRGLIPTLSEMGAEHGSNFAPVMKQMLVTNLVRDEHFEFLFGYLKNYQILAKKILDCMEDKDRAAEIQEIYPILAEQSPMEVTSRTDLEENFDRPETRATLYSLFDPDYFVNMEAIEAKATKELERLSKEGQLTPHVLEPYKQEIPTSLLAEKLLDYFNGKLFTLQIGGASDFMLQAQTIKTLAEDCFDTIVRKRGSAALPYLPESERNFIEERERKLAAKYGITRENLHTFVSKDKMYQEETYQSLNGRIEELLSKKRSNRLAIENRFKLEQPNDDFDHEDAYYYGDEANPVERKQEISQAVESYMADYPGLPLKNHVSALMERVRQRVYLLKRFVHEPKFDSLAYIRDVPFTSGLYHHAGKIGKYAKFAPLERNFDEIIEANSAPDTVARLVLTNYSRALGQNDTLDMKSKMNLMHRFGAYVKKVDAEGGLSMPSPIRPGKLTHMHPNRVNPRDAKLDVLKIDDENDPFWKDMFANMDYIQQIKQKRFEKETRKSDIGRGGKPAPVKSKAKKK